MIGGGGFMAHMANSLKGNKSLLRKKRLFNRERSFKERRNAIKSGLTGRVEDKIIDPLEMGLIKEKIRTKFRKENKINNFINALVLIITCLLVFVFINRIILNDRKYALKQIEKINIKNENQLEYLIKDGELWYSKGNLHNAVYQFEKALELFPERKATIDRLIELYRISCLTENVECEKYDELNSKL